MKLSIAGLAVVMALAFSAEAGHAQTAAASKAAAPSAEDAHRKEDIAKHRRMAKAHEEAAQCLEKGEKEATCQERLRAACQGIAVGRYCGMRHAH